MTEAEANELRGLIFESELAAQVYGRQAQRLGMITNKNPEMKENGERIEREYHDKWGVQSNKLHKFIQGLVK